MFIYTSLQIEPSAAFFITIKVLDNFTGPYVQILTNWYEEGSFFQKS